MGNKKLWLHSLTVAFVYNLVFSLPVAAVCCPSQTTCTLTNVTEACTVSTPANACVDHSVKYFNPSYNNPSMTVYVFKYLVANQNCDLAAPPNNAFCNPGASQNVSRVDASAFNSQITMSPSCSWICMGSCGSISTTAAGDGLPVELMDFKVAGSS